MMRVLLLATGGTIAGRGADSASINHKHVATFVTQDSRGLKPNWPSTDNEDFNTHCRWVFRVHFPSCCPKLPVLGA